MLVKLKLGLTLKNVAATSIAKIIWSSPDFKGQIDFLISQTRQGGSYDDYSPRDCDIAVWIKVVDQILEKIDGWNLPCDVKKYLEKTIVFMGEKILYLPCAFYEKPGFYRRVKNIPYGSLFSQNGRMLSSRLPTRIQHCPVEDVILREWYLRQACDMCRENTIQDFQDEIIDILKDDWLEYTFKEINFNNRKDIVFNILCCWHYRELEVDEFVSDDGDYILPLDIISDHLADVHSPMAKKYFIGKLQSLEVPIVNYISQDTIWDYMVFDKYLRPISRTFTSRELPDDEIEGYIFCANCLISEGKLDVISKNMNIFIKLFLPVWPYQEIFMQLLDFCAEYKINLDHNSLLEYVFFGIGINNHSKYWEGEKMNYMEAFFKIWAMTPEDIKLSFLVEKTKMLIASKARNPGLKFPLIVEEFDLLKEDELNDSIFEAWLEDLQLGQFRTVKDFVRQITITSDDLEKFRKTISKK